MAVGNRWGYTRFNGRRRDPNEGRIGFVFRLAEPRIAPAFVYQYEAGWVKRRNRCSQNIVSGLESTMAFRAIE